MSALLRIDGLRVTFSTPDGDVPAVRGVTLDVEAGSCVAVVGESGSGKSATALSVMGLLPPTATVQANALTFDGDPLLSGDGARGLRGGRIAMVFQDPLTSLNPHLTIGRQIEESVRRQGGLRGGAARRRVVELLEEVGVPEPAIRAEAWPHQLSGGLRQRALIAMGLAGDPDLLIADEPTTALDVTVQAQILRLFESLCANRGMALMLITHDLGVVAEVADHAAVMYAGRIVERGSVTDLFRDPAHPYTRGLLGSLPGVRSAGERLPQIPGSPPDPRSLPEGCPFRPRCDVAVDACADEEPPLQDRGGDRTAACWVDQAWTAAGSEGRP